MPRPPRSLLIALASTLALRLVAIGTLPDADFDAYGHFAIARELAKHPSNILAHWVWLPGWHFVLLALLRLHASFTASRAVVALLGTLVPLIVFAIVHRTSERHALSAALVCAIAPLANVLATSAQTETLFVLLFLGAAWAMEEGRAIPAALLLALASLTRYEAWAAAAALAGWTAWSPAHARRRASVASVVGATTAAFAWISVRARADGAWFSFLFQTVAFAKGHHATLADVVEYVLIAPAKTFGPAILLAPLGLRRAVRSAPALAWMSAGVLIFLTAAASFGGSLALDRHFVSLVPFASVAIAFGAEGLSERLVNGAKAALLATFGAYATWFAIATYTRWNAPLRATSYVARQVDARPILCPDIALEVATELPEDRFSSSLPATGGWVLGWESQLGRLAEAGQAVGRWQSAGDAVVLRVVESTPP